MTPNDVPAPVGRPTGIARSILPARFGRPRVRAVGPAAAWVVGVGCLAAAFVVLARCPQELPDNADILSPAGLYDDLFVSRYPVRAYQHSAATFAVPDAATYFAVRAVAGSTGRAVLPWYMALYGVLTAAAVYALRGVVGPAARPWTGPAGLVVAAWYVAAVAVLLPAGQSEVMLLLLPTNHAGAQACAFVALGLAARYVRAAAGESRTRHLVGLVGVCAAATFSDRLFGVYFAAPVGLTLVVARLTRTPGVTWSRAVAVVAAVAVGCAAGIAGIKGLPNPGTGKDPIDGYTGPKPNLSDLPAHLRGLLDAGWAEVSAGNVLVIVLAAWVAAAGVGLLVSAGRRTAPGLLPVYGLSAVAAVSLVFATSAAGAAELGRPAPSWPAFARYYCGPYALALFGWAGLAAAGFAAGGWRRVVAGGLPAVGLAGLLAYAGSATPPPGDPFHRQCGLAMGIDEVCRRYGMTDGIAGYWEAKQVSLYSDAGVRVVAVDWIAGDRYPIRPFAWLANADRYFRLPNRPADRPRFQFVVAARRPDRVTGREVTVADAVRHFGPPVEEVVLGQHSVLVYNRPQDRALADCAYGPPFQALRYRLDRGSEHWFDGASFPGEGRHDDIGPSRYADEARHRAGLLAFGPYIPAGKPGRYYAAFRLATRGGPWPVAKVDVLADPDGRSPGGFLGRADVVGETDGIVRLEFDVTPEMVGLGLQFRTEFCGTGGVRLDGVAFGPVGR